MSFSVHSTAIVDDNVTIGEGTKIWHFAHICPGARIGAGCIFGQNTMVANDVVIGSNVKVQNNVAIYTGTVVEDDVFLGPSCVLTNVTNPRSQVKRHSLYERTLIRRGTTVGRMPPSCAGSRWDVTPSLPLERWWRGMFRTTVSSWACLDASRAG